MFQKHCDRSYHRQKGPGYPGALKFWNVVVKPIEEAKQRYDEQLKQVQKYELGESDTLGEPRDLPFHYRSIKVSNPLISNLSLWLLTFQNFLTVCY